MKTPIVLLFGDVGEDRKLAQHDGLLARRISTFLGCCVVTPQGGDKESIADLARSVDCLVLGSLHREDERSTWAREGNLFSGSPLFYNLDNFEAWLRNRAAGK